MELFIKPSENITDTTSLDWQHFANLKRDDIVKRWQTPTGEGLLKSLNASRFSREALEKFIGKFNNNFDLRGIDLSRSDLSGLDLSKIDFFAANFSNALCNATNFSNSYLSECDIRGSNFEWAILEGALLDNVKFDIRTSFLGVDLHKVNFTLATLLYDLALSQQRIQQLEKHHPIFAWWLKITCDYGRSFGYYIAWVIGFIVSYAGIYFALMDKDFLDCLYFSVVTFATVGYGDILPVTVLQKIVVMSEIAIGYLMGGLLIAILAKRVIG